MIDWSCRKGLEFGPNPLSPLPDVFGQHGIQYVAPGDRIGGGAYRIVHLFGYLDFLGWKRDGGGRYQATGSPEVQRRHCINTIVLMFGTVHETEQSSLHPLVKHPDNEKCVIWPGSNLGS
jgi:hypothetical protein